MSQVAVDVAGVVEQAHPSSDEILALRASVCTDPAARKAVADYVANLPSDSAEGAADKKLALKKGLALWCVGRESDAAEWLTHSGENVAQAFYGRSLLACGQPGAAVKALEGHGDDAAVAPVLAEAYACLGDSENCAKAAKAVTAPAESAYLKGRILDLECDRPGATEAYHDALDADEGHSGALFRLAHGETLYGDEDQAIELYRQCIETTCPPVNAFLNLGNVYEDRGEFSRARECYRSVLDADPRNLRARMFLKDASASLNMFYDEDMERRADRRSQVMRLPVTDFELSVRSRNCLAKMGVRSLGDLIQRTESELLSYKNFGETSLQEIKDILAQKSLRLGMGRDEIQKDDEARSILESMGGDAAVAAGADADEASATEKPLSDLELSVRSRHCMGLLGLASVGDLCAISEAELMTIKNFGQTSLNEVKQKLAELGLSLKPDA